MQVETKFDPGDWIQITAYGLGYQGRISRISFGGASGRIIYEVEYTVDGGFAAREFFEDEITLSKKKEKKEKKSPSAAKVLSFIRGDKNV